MRNRLAATPNKMGATSMVESKSNNKGQVRLIPDSDLASISKKEVKDANMNDK